MDFIKEIKEFLDYLGVKNYRICDEVDIGDGSELKIVLRRGSRKLKVPDATYYPNMNLIVIEGATESKLTRLGLIYLILHELSHLKVKEHNEDFAREFLKLYKKLQGYVKSKNLVK